jgi:signal transduction histidine kinase
MNPGTPTSAPEAAAPPLDARTAHLRELVEASSEGMVRLDRNGRAVTWNSAAAHLLAPAATLTRGTLLSDAFAEAGLVQGLLERSLQGDPVIGQTLDLGGTGDVHRQVELTLVPVRHRGRRPVETTALLRDASAELRLREALKGQQEANEELRRLNGLKDELLSTAAHELRTPLTSVGGFASLLAKTAPEQIELIEPIERNAREMQRLVEALLDQARLESGQVTVHPMRFALAPAVDRLLADISEQLDGSHVVTHVARDATIDMDEQAFTLVLGNLVTNAAKYGAEGTITISALQGPGSVTVSVADEGPGIPVEHQAHLFEPFFRVPGDQWSIRGSGFGLSIVRRYVELHDGQVACESSPGVGTTFSFTVPTIQPD